MYVITGGAGFIGSNIAAALDQQGADIVVSDWLGANDFKWRNIAKCRLSSTSFRPKRLDRSWTPIGKRLPASSTWEQSLRQPRPTSMRSCATTSDSRSIFGSGARARKSRWSTLHPRRPTVTVARAFLTVSTPTTSARLRPLNAYGWSKALFDRWVQHAVATGAPCPPRWVGLKFFNVYGPNEYHKDGQRSVAAQLHTQIRETGRVRLFRSENPDYPDGGQLRDFVWVGDCVRVALWALQEPGAQSGLYNVGSGTARTFLDKAKIMFAEMGVAPNVDFIDLPAALRSKYQYYTCGSIDKLRLAGYAGAVHPP